MATREHERRANSTAVVNFDRNHYSVDASSAGRPVTLRAQGARVVIVAEGQTVGEHARLSGRNQIAYNPWHYLKVLERKPGALRNGAPFRDWDLALPSDSPQRRPAQEARWRPAVRRGYCVPPNSMAWKR
jgi:Mu transposase-like protein